MTKKRASPSWTARFSLAGRYCSPACGRGCTYDEYLHAKTAGEALAAELGAGWTVRVWENLGWHYAVTSPCRRLTLHANPHGYSAFFAGGRWVLTRPSARDALNGVVALAKQELQAIGASFLEEKSLTF